MLNSIFSEGQTQSILQLNKGFLEFLSDFNVSFPSRRTLKGLLREIRGGSMIVVPTV
jgi:hypothetical protein